MINYEKVWRVVRVDVSSSVNVNGNKIFTV